MPLDEDEEPQPTILPFADETNSITPLSDDGLIVPVHSGLQSRQSSYTSHSSRLSYSSHNELLFKLATNLEIADQNSPSKVYDNFDEKNKHNQTSLFLNEVKNDRLVWFYVFNC